MINTLNVGRMGLMQHTTFYATGGFSANTLTGIGSTYQPYYSQMIDCTCQTGSSFSTTSSNTLYVDNATWVKSGGTILVSGNLSLNIDYGFPNKISTSSLSSGQYLKYDGTQWTNQSVSIPTQLSNLSDCTIANAITNQGLIYNGTKFVNSQIDHTTLNNIGTYTQTHRHTHRH